MSYVTTAYLVRLMTEPFAAEPDEVTEVGWFTDSEIAQLPLGKAAWVREVIADATRVIVD